MDRFNQPIPITRVELGVRYFPRAARHTSEVKDV